MLASGWWTLCKFRSCKNIYRLVGVRSAAIKYFHFTPRMRLVVDSSKKGGHLKHLCKINIFYIQIQKVPNKAKLNPFESIWTYFSPIWTYFMRILAYSDIILSFFSMFVLIWNLFCSFVSKSLAWSKIVYQVKNEHIKSFRRVLFQIIVSARVAVLARGLLIWPVACFSDSTGNTTSLLSCAIQTYFFCSSRIRGINCSFHACKLPSLLSSPSTSTIITWSSNSWKKRRVCLSHAK